MSAWSNGVGFLGGIMTFRTSLGIIGAAVLLGLLSTPSRAFAQEPVKIGVILPLTGSSAAIGQEDLKGIQFAIDEEGGALAGHPIQLVIADDQNSPNVGLTETRRLVENEKVSAVIGSLNSAVALAIHAFTTRSKVPYISGGIVRDLTDSRKSPYTFRASVAAGQLEGVIAQFVVQNGWPNVILMGSDYAAGRDAVLQVGRTVKLLKGNVVSEIFPRAGETDYAPYFSRMADSKADAVYGFFFGGDTLRFVRQYKSFGLKFPLIMTDVALSAGGVAQSLGKDIDGVYSVEYWYNGLNDHKSKEFIAAFTKKYGMAPEGIAYCGYVQGRAIVEALKKLDGKPADGDAFAKAIKGVSFDGPGGGVKFDANNNPIARGYFVRWSWDGTKPSATLLKTVDGITQDWSPAK
jgi:branched-chain amino acid transport system substrate-binding protein